MRVKTAKRAQFGYNIVEIAIVLTVALMMSSWLAVNYYEVQQNERVQETERSIALIKTALVEYAANNTNQSFRVQNAAATAATDIYWRLPAGRPYLPCPDITGDGVEDRQGITRLYPDGAQLADGSYAALIPNDCLRYKGTVPWRTLGTPRTDAWGNYFTYRVDPAFASSLLGFDQETTSDDATDIGNASPPLTVTTLASGQTIVMRTHTPLPDADLVQSAAAAATVRGIWGGNIRSENSPSLICDSAPCSFSTPAANIVIGETATALVTLQTGGYAFDRPVFSAYVANNITEGVPVVILSHGQNGYGAVSGAQQTAEGIIRCNAMPAGHADEQQNALRVDASVSCPQVMSADGRQNGFVYRVQSSDHSAGGFDDVVGWMSTLELTQRLFRRGVFPVEKLPPVGLEGY